MRTMSSKAALAATVLALLAWVPALAVEATAVAPSKQTVAGRYLDAREAYRMKQELGLRAYFIDVRTRYEVAYVGLPTVVDANIAVYTVVDGFEGDAIASGDKQGQRLLNGWKNAGLPWSYNLGKARAYFPQY